ncbi:hypothetical protein LIER_43375 [Lithospermum erythrorhizon]|uniref:GATA-type domain-containing protein n=1 Tax=Lithospermum erythrorhizon TaxID=34254 RepID=A0AAV3PY90_LITER
MKDHSRKEGASADQAQVLIKKCCLHCKTTRTPMWRIGPSGPKSLCNACGIRFRKKSSEVLNVQKHSSKNERRSRKKSLTVKSLNKSKKCCVEVVGKRKKLRKDLSFGLRSLGKEVVLSKRQRSSSKRKHRKMGEVEQAALLLMALSCASVSESEL